MYISELGLHYDISEYVHGDSPYDISEFQTKSASANMMPLTDEKLDSGFYWAVAHEDSKVLGISGITYLWEGGYAEKGGSYVLEAYRRHGIGYQLGCFVTAKIESMGLVPMTLCNELSAGLNIKAGYTQVPHETLPQAVYDECSGCETPKAAGALCCHTAFVKLGLE